jgi:hypothetical protein
VGGVLNDFGCKRCGKEDRNRVLPMGEAPICCGRPMLTLWDHGQAPATNMHEPQYNHATGKWHRSTREAEMELAKMAGAWSERTGMKWSAPKIAGDKHHGARYESKPSNAAFGYAGQTRRDSTGERPRLADRGIPVVAKRQRRIDTSEHIVNGVAPRRMSKDQADAYRRSATHD